MNLPQLESAHAAASARHARLLSVTHAAHRLNLPRSAAACLNTVEPRSRALLALRDTLRAARAASGICPRCGDGYARGWWGGLCVDCWEDMG